MKRLFASAALVAVSNIAAAACPTTVQLYKGSSWGEVFSGDVINYHETFILQKKPGSVYNVVPTPQFSIPQPLKSAADLDRLTHEDWLKIVEYIKRSQDASPPRRRGDVPEQDAAIEKAEKLTTKNFDAVVNCFLAQTAKVAGVKEEKSQPVEGNQGSLRELAGKSEKLIEDDSNALVYGELSGAARESGQLYRDGLVEQMAAKKNGTKFDTRAPIIAPGCIKFRNWGTGVAHDVKQITSTCKVPVAVTHCFYDTKTPDKCKTNKSVGWGTTNVIRPGGTALVVAGTQTKGSRLMVDYYVCDMRNEDKIFCLKP